MSSCINTQNTGDSLGIADLAVVAGYSSEMGHVCSGMNVCVCILNTLLA